MGEITDVQSRRMFSLLAELGATTCTPDQRMAALQCVLLDDLAFKLDKLERTISMALSR